MSKEQTNFRIDAAAKQKAYAVLHQIGLKPTEAVNMFMHHIALYGELPFKPGIPNAQTRAAMRESDARENQTRYESVDAMFQGIISDK